MAKQAKKAAVKPEAVEGTVKPTTLAAVLVAAAAPQPEAAEQPKAAEGANESPEVMAQFAMLEAIKSAAAAEAGRIAAGEKQQGAYSALTALAAADAAIFTAAWSRVKEAIRTNANGCAVVAGCRLLKSGDYAVPKSAVVAASELSYAIANRLPLEDGAGDKIKVLSFSKIREGNSQHRHAAAVKAAQGNEQEMAYYNMRTAMNGLQSDLAKVQAAFDADKMPSKRLANHIDPRMLAAMIAMCEAIEEGREAFKVEK